MSQRWNSERELLAFLPCVLACVLLAIISAGRDWTRAAMDAVADSLSWAELPAVAVVSDAAELRRWTRDRRVLLLEAARLREENRALRLALGKSETEAISEVARKGNSSPVIYRDPRTWWDSVRIKTPADVPQGSPVLDGSYLIGVVASSDGGSAWVQLVTSVGFYAPVVLEGTREIGVVTGDGNGGVWLRYVTDWDRPAGTRIFTAMGGTLPQGIPVGVLTDEKRPYMPGIYDFRVDTGADVFRLQYVNVGGVGE